MNRLKTKRAVIVVFEGIDGCGKSTQAKKFASYLRAGHRKVIFLKEPGSTKIGKKIREILLSEKNRISPLCELLLYLAARSQLYEEILKKSINKPVVVVFDRFIDSTTAYQGYGRDIPLDFIDKAHEMIIQNLKPDITFIIDIPAEKLKEYIKKKGADRLEKSLAFQKKVRNGYLAIAKKNPVRIRVIKRKNVEETFQEIVGKWKNFIGNNQ